MWGLSGLSLYLCVCGGVHDISFCRGPATLEALESVCSTSNRQTKPPDTNSSRDKNQLLSLLYLVQVSIIPILLED